jgi:hypothetical protein
MVPFNDGGWLEPHGHNFPEQYTESEQTKIRAIALAAIYAYLGDDMVVVPLKLAQRVTSIARRNEDAPEIHKLSAMLSAELTVRDAG